MNIVEVGAVTNNHATKTFANVVVFAYFTDTPQYLVDYMASEEFHSEIMKTYDTKSPNDGYSFTRYMDAISYGQFNVVNVFPQDNGTTFSTIALPFSQASLPDTYNISLTLTSVRVGLSSISLDPDTVIDYDNNGTIDNFTMVLGNNYNIPLGDNINDSPNVWSHQFNYAGGSQVFGKTINMINVLNTEQLINVKSENSYIYGESGLVAHEFMHSFRYADLYTNNDLYKPVNTWDIMANIPSFLQYPLAYTRHYFSDWISIDTVKTSRKGLVLHDQSNADGNQAYIIKSPLNPYEFFVVEYRVKGEDFGDLDFKIPGTGLIVYRIDTTVVDLWNTRGQTGVYVFRDGGDPLNEYNAFLTPEPVVFDELGLNFTTNTTFGGTASELTLEDNAITYSDGRNSGIVIDNIQSINGGAAMSFDVSIPLATDFDLWEDTGYGDTSGGERQYIFSTMHNNILYTVSTENTYALSSYNGETWNHNLADLSVEPGHASNISNLFTIGNKLYFSFIDNNFDIIIRSYDINTNSWDQNEVLHIPEGAYSNSYGMTTDGSKIFISYFKDTANGNIPAFKIVDTANSANNIDYISTTEPSYMFGQIDVSLLNGIPYIFYTNALYGYNDLYIYKYENNTYTKVTSISGVASYDVMTFNNKLYILASPTNESVKLYTFDNIDGLSAGKVLDAAAFNPKLAVAQGYLYMLGSYNSGALYTYRYDDQQDTFIQEGELVTNNATDYNLLSTENILYTTYSEKDSQDNFRGLVVDKKTTANELLSLTIEPPDRTSYLLGASVSTEGLKVTANYTESTKELNAGDYIVNDFDTATTGERFATVTFEGVSNTFGFYVANSIEPTADLSGTIVSHYPDTTPTVELYAPNDTDFASPLYTATISAATVENSATTTHDFTFIDVNNGIYNLVIREANHVNVVIEGVEIFGLYVNLNTHQADAIKKIHMPAGDFNNDGKVTNDDLSAILAVYNTPATGDEKLDVNGDGKINFADLATVRNSKNFVSEAIYAYK